MATSDGALSNPTAAFVGSTLTLAGAGLVAVPFGFLASAPCLFVGIPLSTFGTLVPADDDLSGTRKFLAAMSAIAGAICLLIGCILTSILTMAHLVAAKHGGQGFSNTSELSATLLFCLATVAFFALGDWIRGASSMSGTLLRSLYWFLHFPGTVAAAKIVAAAGVPLSA